MRFFLDTLVGDGTLDADSENPFRAEHADGAHSMLNLRPAPFCLVGADALIGTPVIDFGDTLDQVLKNNRIRALGNRLGITLDQTDFRSIIAELMILHGKEDGSRWRPLKQNTKGRHKIWLGQGQLVYDAPVIQGTILQDTFVETGGDVLLSSHTATGPNSGYAWTNVLGALEVDDNQDRAEGETGVDNGRSRADSDLASADHYAELDIDFFSSSSVASFGPIVRFDPSADTHYLLHLRDRSDDQYRIFETTTGTNTLVGSAVTEALVLAHTYRLEINGSSLEGFKNGVSKITGTDTVVQGHKRAGITLSRGHQIDDFKAEDLVTHLYPPWPRRQLTTVRM